jgi:hypothetical protein
LIDNGQRGNALNTGVFAHRRQSTFAVLLSSLLKNSEKAVIPNPGDFCRGEESAFSLASCKMQIPRFAGDDIPKKFFNKLLSFEFASPAVPFVHRELPK